MVLGMVFVVLMLIPTEYEDVSDRVDQDFRSGMIEGCVEGDTELYQYCVCATDYIDEHYTNEEIYNTADKIYEGAYYDDDMFDRAYEKCGYLYE